MSEREDYIDVKEKYIELVKRQLENGTTVGHGLWDARQLGWNEKRMKRYKQEIQPSISKKTFLMP